MDLDLTFQLVNDVQILPGINELVNILFTETINDFIDKKNGSDEDRRVILMFLIMYFYSYTSIKTVHDKENIKKLLKAFLSELIINREKRIQCLELFRSFENSIHLFGKKIQ